MTTTETELQFKVNDVFSFRYNEEEAKKRFEPYHCFDGQLVVKEINGKLVLVDTYWGSGDNRRFTIEEAKKQGHLIFKCNLDEVEKADHNDGNYYNDEDIINLSTQHGCYKRIVKRKGATRSKDKMLQTAKDKIEELERKIKSAQRDIEWLNDSIEKINLGDLSVYL
jgi:hypothetical protein